MVGTALNSGYSGRHPIMTLGSGPLARGLHHWTPHSLGFSISSPSKSGFKLFFCSISTCWEQKLERNIRKRRKNIPIKNNCKESTSPGSLRVPVILSLFWALATLELLALRTSWFSAHALHSIWNSLFLTVHLENFYSLPCTAAQRSPLLWGCSQLIREFGAPPTHISMAPGHVPSSSIPQAPRDRGRPSFTTVSP